MNIMLQEAIFMDKSELEKRAEQYRQEMLRMYSSGKSIPESKPAPESSNDSAENEKTNAEIANSPDDSAWSEHQEEHYDINEYNNKYPEPDLSGLDTDFGTENMIDSKEPEYASEESLGNSKGFIIVNVRTGDESSAVSGATVMVTALVDGKRMIIASGVTNASGTTPKFEVPVPSLELSQAPNQKVRPYNLFDVSVSAEGFFNARSVDVPVFSGITSVQNFNMIPVPTLMRSNDETVTYYNQEPSFDDIDGTEGI